MMNALGYQPVRLREPGGYSALFAPASSQYLSAADSASLSMGDIDFVVGAWIRPDSIGAGRVIVSKGNLAVSYVAGEYSLECDSSGRAWLYIGNGSTQGQASTATNAIVADTWTLVVGWHDAVNNTVNIRLNQATATSSSYSGGSQDTAFGLRVGAWSNYAGGYFSGRIGPAFVCKSPPGGVAGIIDALTASVFNAGLGTNYGRLTTAEKTDWGLVEWWDLNEYTGTRYGAHAGLNLTDNGTVPRALGLF